MTAVHIVVPEGIDDPVRPSGGNAYDRQVCRGLRRSAGRCTCTPYPAWPRPDEASCAALVDVVPGSPTARRPARRAGRFDCPGGAGPEASRLRLVALVHMPLGHGTADDGARERERAVLASAQAVVTTSAWARRRLLDLYALPADRVHVAEPGADAADLAPGSATGGALLCVGAVTPGKGHDVLLEALATVGRLRWHCVCVGSLDRDPAFVEGLRRRVLDDGLAAGCASPGRRPEPTSPQLRRGGRAGAASRAETYGMVVTEALARGLPVVAADVGECRRHSGTAPTASGRGCSSRPATRPRSAKRCGPGSGRRPAAAAASGGARAACVARRLVDDHLRRRRTSSRGWRDDRRDDPGQPGWLDLRESADAAARARSSSGSFVAVFRPAVPW